MLLSSLALKAELTATLTVLPLAVPGTTTGVDLEAPAAARRPSDHVHSPEILTLVVPAMMNGMHSGPAVRDMTRVGIAVGVTTITLGHQGHSLAPTQTTGENDWNPMM